MYKRQYYDFPVSVNVSRADIYSVDITDLLISIVQKYELAPKRLHLEITESAYTENSKQLIEVTSRLRELGFVLEMDDFGSGYSSLNMLNQMPIDVLKLDMKFIQSETAKPLEHGILQFVIDLARRMHLSVVAEGVETREQLERLLEVDCDYVQGYYFARPMPAEEFEQFLKKEKLRGKLGGITFSNNEDRSGHYKQLLLIADEDEQYIEQVRKNFSALFHVMAAADVNTALNLVAEQGDQIALVLLSHSLSKDGTFAVLELIQRNRDLWKIPVIITGPREESAEVGSSGLRSQAPLAGKPHKAGGTCHPAEHLPDAGRNITGRSISGSYDRRAEPPRLAGCSGHSSQRGCSNGRMLF